MGINAERPEMRFTYGDVGVGVVRGLGGWVAVAAGVGAWVGVEVGDGVKVGLGVGEGRGVGVAVGAATRTCTRASTMCC